MIVVLILVIALMIGVAFSDGVILDELRGAKVIKTSQPDYDLARTAYQAGFHDGTRATSAQEKVRPTPESYDRGADGVYRPRPKTNWVKALGSDAAE